MLLILWSISFKLQIIEYAEYISFINFYKKLFQSQKIMQVKNATNFPHFLKFCDIHKKTNLCYHSIYFLDTLYWWSYSKCWYENRCLDSGYNTRGIQGQHSAYNSTSPGHHHGQWSRAGHEGGKSGRVQLPISAVKGFTLSLL